MFDKYLLVSKQCLNCLQRINSQGHENAIEKFSSLNVHKNALQIAENSVLLILFWRGWKRLYQTQQTEENNNPHRHIHEKKRERNRKEKLAHFPPFPYFPTHIYSQPNITFFRYNFCCCFSRQFFFPFLSTRHCTSFFFSFLLQFIFGDGERLTVLVKCECKISHLFCTIVRD